ncbi:MAG: ABC transporter ATP-binding protein [Candidatus Aminicenantia bacterium]
MIKNVSFSLTAGEMVCILGRNGSGKSTLIKGLQKMLKNSKGEVIVLGEDIFNLTPKEIARKIAYVPQLVTHIFEFSVIELISMARYVYQGKIVSQSKEDQEKIEEAMELTQVTELRNRKIVHLSGGERQRVLIARALAQDTPLIFLDEPSSHLDINYQIEIYQLLSKLQNEKGKAILCTEHNINLVIPYAQQIIFLKKGKIFCQGKPEELITEENIKEVFRAEVEVRENPASRLPEISLFRKQEAGSRKQEAGR